MTDDPQRVPRSPAKVALLTFGAVVLIGMMVTLAITGLNDHGGASPFEKGEAAGRVVGMAAGLAAAIGYVVQRNRLRK